MAVIARSMRDHAIGPISFLCVMIGGVCLERQRERCLIGEVDMFRVAIMGF